MPLSHGPADRICTPTPMGNGRSGLKHLARTPRSAAPLPARDGARPQRRRSSHRRGAAVEAETPGPRSPQEIRVCPLAPGGWFSSSCLLSWPKPACRRIRNATDFGLRPRSSQSGIPPPVFRVDYEEREPGIETVRSDRSCEVEAAEVRFWPRSRQKHGAQINRFAARSSWRRWQLAADVSGAQWGRSNPSPSPQVSCSAGRLSGRTLVPPHRRRPRLAASHSSKAFQSCQRPSSGASRL